MIFIFYIFVLSHISSVGANGTTRLVLLKISPQHSQILECATHSMMAEMDTVHVLPHKQVSDEHR